MPDETRAIEPALTAEEWRQGKRPQYYREQPCIRWFSDGRVLISEDEMRDGKIVEGATEIVQVRDVDSLLALMALANAALPDDDPRKITRDDVVSLYETADAIERAIGSKMIGVVHVTGPSGDMLVSATIAETFRALGMKLESLLPPDVTTYTQVPPEE